MKNLFALFVCLLLMVAVNAQSLYIKTFGSSAAKPLIFLHGGPGYNCASFEASTAQKLADEGYFVIVYDRRGEGRSIDKNVKFTFDETFADLKDIYKKYGIEKATLLGHSFGGVVATLFTEKNPDMVNSVVLISAPVSLQETFKTIIATAKTIYQAKNDTVNLNYLNILSVIDTNTMQYASYCFAHAMQNGYYTAKKNTDDAKKIYAELKKDSLYPLVSQMTYPAPAGFLKNEKYTIINLTENIKALCTKGMKIYGLYGKDDGLYSPAQVAALQKLIGDANLQYLDDCSHNVFIDQQTSFIAALKTYCPPSKALTINGEGYGFALIEPDGWKSDQQNAKDFDAEIVLYMNHDSVEKGAALVQLATFKKADENTIEDLNTEVNQYKSNYPELAQEDFTATHQNYQCYSTCVHKADEFYQYLVYINPGPQFKRGVSIALNTSNRPPTETEMNGFKKIIASLVMLK